MQHAASQTVNNQQSNCRGRKGAAICCNNAAGPAPAQAQRQQSLALNAACDKREPASSFWNRGGKAWSTGNRKIGRWSTAKPAGARRSTIVPRSRSDVTALAHIAHFTQPHSPIHFYDRTMLSATEVAEASAVLRDCLGTSNGNRWAAAFGVNPKSQIPGPSLRVTFLAIRSAISSAIKPSMEKRANRMQAAGCSSGSDECSSKPKPLLGLAELAEAAEFLRFSGTVWGQIRV